MKYLTHGRSNSERLLFRLHICDHAGQDALLDDLLRTESASIVSFLNAHSYNIAHRNTEFFRALIDSDYLLRDGVGVKIACWLYRRDAGLNLNGTDLIPKIISAFAGRRIMLCGTREETLQMAAHVVRSLGTSDLVTMNGFQSAEKYMNAVRAAEPSLIVLGMGMPKQELLARELKELCLSLDIRCVIVNGGAVIDFLSGTVRRAPYWMRQIGLEWLFRLGQEPKRLANRYLVGIPLFIALVLRDRIRGLALSNRSAASHLADHS